MPDVEDDAEPCAASEPDPYDEFKGPSFISGLVISISMMLGALVCALIIMLQWFLWFAITSQIYDMWGMVLGIAICAAQMLMMFSDKKTVNC